MEFKKLVDVTVSNLGMGNMRLPLNEDKKIDYEKADEIISYAIANGINYFDTAYVYNGGDSERFLGHSMARFPRDSFYLASKYPIFSGKDYKEVFEEELERLHTDHIDFYLLHCLMDRNIDDYLNSGAIEYFLEQKEKGRIKYLGFSSHASVDTLRRFADHHKWDFAQLQINYFDWKYSTSKEEYKILEERGIPCIVMEPVRGGRLASLTPEAEAILKEAHPDWSIPSWALRFVRTLPNVKVILSGMSTMDQIVDNCNTFSTSETLSAEDMATLDKALEVFHKAISVPCTACRYCCDTCPMQINIPEWMKLYNEYKLEGAYVLKGAEKIESVGKPSDCISCGACTAHCPQNIEIPAVLAELAEALNK